MSKMEETLERQFEREAERLEVPEADLDSVVARGRRRRTMTAVGAAGGAALGVLLLVGASSALFRMGTVAPPAAQEAVTTTTAANVTTTTGTTSSTTVAVEAAPWSGESVAAEQVPPVLVDEWSAAENQGWCAALAPVELAQNTVATPRAANFAGGWAIAWDAPTGPGALPSGAPCTDCGRSAFGIAGTGTTPDADTGVRQPSVLRFGDGSVAGYGGAGFDQAASQRLAEIVIPGQGCMYQAWSYLGDEHLLSLVESLRFVDGLDDGPVTLYDTLPVESIDGGPAPWSLESIPADEIPDVLASQWTDISARVYFADLGDDLQDATARSAALGVWGVAWDRPGGPGHDASNVACSECGRGVIGLGLTSEWSGTSVLPELPVEIRWEDGSAARYGVRIGRPSIPMDLQRITDPDTGALIHPGYEAVVQIEGVGEFVVWSHLGEDHLRYLLGQLRVVG